MGDARHLDPAGKPGGGARKQHRPDHGPCRRQAKARGEVWSAGEEGIDKAGTRSGPEPQGDRQNQDSENAEVQPRAIDKSADQRSVRQRIAARRRGLHR